MRIWSIDVIDCQLHLYNILTPCVPGFVSRKGLGYLPSMCGEVKRHTESLLASLDVCFVEGVAFLHRTES